MHITTLWLQWDGWRFLLDLDATLDLDERQMSPTFNTDGHCAKMRVKQ